VPTPQPCFMCSSELICCGSHFATYSVYTNVQDHGLVDRINALRGEKCILSVT
jgi:hypothetical protein